MTKPDKCLHCEIANAINSHARECSGGDVILNVAIGAIAENLAELLSLAPRNERRLLMKEVDKIVKAGIAKSIAAPGHKTFPIVDIH